MVCTVELLYSLLRPTTARKQRHPDIRDTAATPAASHTGGSREPARHVCNNTHEAI